MSMRMFFSLKTGRDSQGRWVGVHWCVCVGDCVACKWDGIRVADRTRGDLFLF